MGYEVEAMWPLACSVPKFGDLSSAVPKFIVELILVSAGLAFFLVNLSPIMFKRAKAVQIKIFAALGWAVFAACLALVFIPMCKDNSLFVARTTIYPAVICITSCFAKVEKVTFGLALLFSLASTVALQ